MSHEPQTAVIDLMISLLSTTLGVQTSVLSPGSEELTDIDYSLRKSIFTGHDARELFSEIMEKPRRNISTASRTIFQSLYSHAASGKESFRLPSGRSLYDGGSQRVPV